MRKIIIGLIGSFLISAVFADVASASTPKLPNVVRLRPFSGEADYMSLPGYLRYLLHLQTGQWLTYKDAAQKVQSG